MYIMITSFLLNDMFNFIYFWFSNFGWWLSSIYHIIIVHDLYKPTPLIACSFRTGLRRVAGLWAIHRVLLCEQRQRSVALSKVFFQNPIILFPKS